MDLAERYYQQLGAMDVFPPAFLDMILPGGGGGIRHTRNSDSEGALSLVSLWPLFLSGGVLQEGRVFFWSLLRNVIKALPEVCNKGCPNPKAYSLKPKFETNLVGRAVSRRAPAIVRVRLQGSYTINFNFA